MKFATVRTFALSLGAVTEEPHHHFSSFRVGGKIFVTVPPDQEHVHVFTDELTREQALAMHPAFMEKLLWGGKVVGVRVALQDAAPSAVKQLVTAAFVFKSTPKVAARAKRATHKP